MRLLLDSSVVFTYLMSRSPADTAIHALLERAVDDDVVLVWSASIEAEIRAKHAVRPAMQARVPSHRLELALAQLSALSDIVRPPTHPPPRVVRDLAEDFIVDLAVAGRVDMVVTLDRDLLSLESFAGIAFVKPGAALDALRDAGLLPEE